MSMRDIAASVARDIETTGRCAEEAVAATIAAIVTGLADFGEVVVTGLGKFTVVDVPARMGRNPRTGEPVEIAAQRKVKFRPSRTLKEALNP